MTEKNKRCAIYIRVSTVEQKMHGKSLEAQKEYLSRYAKDHGMIVKGIYADEGKTARKQLKSRKAIHALLNDVKAGEIDVILFWKMDRWFRSVADFYKVQDILDEYGVRWLAAAEPNINIETRDGRLQLNLYLSIGQNEVDTTSERIKFVNEVSIQQGKLIFGKANMPFGYKVGTNEKGEKRMVKDAETEHMVTDCFRHFLNHQTKSATVTYMHETYGIEFSYTMLSTMLSSEFYIGKYRDNDNYCPAYLTFKEWEQIQAITKKNIKSTSSGRIYYFSGLMRCPGCGQKLSGTGHSSIINHKTGHKKHYCYYRCNQAHINKICSNRRRVSQNLIEQYLLDGLEPLYNHLQLNCIHIRQKKKMPKRKRTPQKIQAEIKRLNLLFQKERIKWDYYDREYYQLTRELAKLSEPVKIPEQDFTHIEKMIQEGFRKIYSHLSAENKQAFWRTIIQDLHLDDNCTVNGITFY